MTAIQVRQLSPELAAKARDELNEVESRIPEAIAMLREWIGKQPHLKAKTDEQFLLNILRGVKYSMEKAKQKIDYFYSFRSVSPDLFHVKRIDEKALRIVKLGPFLPLPTPFKPDGPRIYFTRFTNIVPSQINVTDLTHNLLKLLDIQMLEDDHTVIGGVINIADIKGIHARLLLQMNMVLYKKMGMFVDKALPFRVKEFHLFNVSKEALGPMNLLKNFLGKKIKDRYYIHSSVEDVFKHIPKEYFPEEYGGTNGSLEKLCIEWENKYAEHKDFFEDEMQYLTNENLRVGTKVTSESLYGIDGTFRKLEVD